MKTLFGLSVLDEVAQAKQGRDYPPQTLLIISTFSHGQLHSEEW